MKVKWDLFKLSYPFVCDECGYFLWEMREICEGCGSKNTLRRTTRKDHKEKMKRK